MVMMLEPLHACNLTCTGCGRIREYEIDHHRALPLEECLAAVDECGAPMVSICGGEPMMYPQIGPSLCAEILKRGKYIHLCTNGMFIAQAAERVQAGHRLLLQRSSGRHGEESRICVERDGVFKEAIEGIKAAKAAGFKVPPTPRSTTKPT